jgi:CHAD domain-containing protein
VSSKLAETSKSTRVAVGGAAVAAGATAAAAKALLDRRGGRSRTYRLQRGEDVFDGIRRIAAGRAESAIDHLRGKRDEPFATSVHEARKDLKKLRSVLRLVRAPLGDEVYRRENIRFRNAGRMLSGPRDARVKLDTLAALEERFGDSFPDRELTPLATALERERQELTDRSAGDNGGGSVATAARQIEDGHDAISDWKLDGDGFDLIADGLKRSYRRGRNRFADTQALAGPETVHEWRKRVKDLWYHLRLVRDARPSKLGKAADEAHDLSDLLGDHHDLTVLREDAMQRAGLFDGDVLIDFVMLVEQRQRELVDSATSLAKSVYADKPKKFVSRIEGYWADWR